MKKEGKTRKLGYEAALLTASKALSLTMTMVTTMLLSWFCTLEEYGTYSQMHMAVTLAAAVFMLGLPNSISYFLSKADTQAERGRFLSAYYALNTLLGALMGGVLFAGVSLLIWYFKNEQIGTYAYFLLIYPWAYVTDASVENVLVVYHKSPLLIAYRLLGSFSKLAVIAIVRLLHLGFHAYLIALLSVVVFFAAAVYCIVWRLAGGLKPSWNTKLFGAIFRFSLPIGLGTVVGTLDIELDKLLIGKMMDTEQFAVYTNASKELPTAFVASALTAVMLPRITVLLKENKPRKAAEVWNWAVELGFAFLALIAFGVIVYAEDVMRLLYSDKYLSGITIFRIYAVAAMVRMTYYGMILNAAGKTRKILKWGVYALLLNAVLNVALFMLLGVIGPAIATVLSIAITALGQLIESKNELGVSFREIFPWKRMLVIVSINLLLAGVFGCAKELLPLERYIGSLAESILLGLMWTAIYFAALRNRLKLLWRSMNELD